MSRALLLAAAAGAIAVIAAIHAAVAHAQRPDTATTITIVPAVRHTPAQRALNVVFDEEEVAPIVEPTFAAQR